MAQSKLGESITIFLLMGGATILPGVIVTNSSRPPAIVAESLSSPPLGAGIEPLVVAYSQPSLEKGKD